ncbi:DUF2848 domain-containing protein [Psychromarinibacter halotolerans]|uniref:DUF2848 domain-containing protein n=1 Tax=Psychromarinibacter halotolerans TaxID=1775175 RepID=A0ABV7GVF4_9RHOB|nr:DUF2848 domain-containing protein [Psychromarinibacter halotolerans]MDF0596843.1 DUF2848 domain-containing protein [Psychromarinibacter halotolerans]
MSTNSLEFQCTAASGEATLVSIDPASLVIAGWAGRDSAAVEAHIKELEEIGVARPRRTPMFYRLAPSLVTVDAAMDVVGREATGEAEVVLVNADGALCIGIGSDHTDRKLEAVGVTLSKQICGKPVGAALWKLDDLRGHWDQLVLRSLVWRDGEWQLYQEGTLAGLMSPDMLLEQYAEEGGTFGPGSVMFCGTVPIIGALYFAEKMALELVDPVLERTLRHEFGVNALQIAD